MNYPSRHEMRAFIDAHFPDMGQKLRRLEEKESFLREKNVYGEPYSDRQLAICYDAIFRTEYLRCRILEFIKDEAKSVKEIASALEEPTGVILKEIVELRRKNLINLERIHERTPFYRAA